MATKLENRGFGLIEGLIIVVIVATVGFGSWAVYHHEHKLKVSVKSKSNTSSTQTNSQKKTTSAPPSTQPADPYAGWITHCEPTNLACIKYPSDWNPVAHETGAFENTAETAYVALGIGTVKDGGAETAYIYSVTSLPTSATPVDIVGFIVNNQPGYELFTSSYVAAAGITAGSTQSLADINYSFEGKQGEVSLTTTPDINGYAAIKTLDQAKAWFTTLEGQTCFKIMQSFYYE